MCWRWGEQGEKERGTEKEDRNGGGQGEKEIDQADRMEGREGMLWGPDQYVLLD